MGIRDLLRVVILVFFIHPYSRIIAQRHLSASSSTRYSHGELCVELRSHLVDNCKRFGSSIDGMGH